ncbi:DUF7282 domain-containing protein [Halococcus salifodinae]|uniref:DUF7282 domain-containing protein n=1 Tax=Halococcus salifodinae DSM 8989 TaxID=1227456 RepID=M0N2E7_9EURY|nr:hypothetical protein [Halococcus salifodinae]EMA52016.1 hypothetical protein C450_11893 [Halococcus salifodinae DSM 8989]
MVTFIGIGLVMGVLIGPVTAAGAENATNASITLDQQTTNGSTLVVRSVTVPEGGFVVVHGSSYLKGYGVSDAIAVSEYLGPGTHENVTVRLSTRVPGSLDDRRRLTVSDRVGATVHRDTNDNHRLEYYRADAKRAIDQPYGGLAHPVEDTAFATITGSRAAPDVRSADERVAIRFADQSADNATLTVAAVTLPRGGYVSVHTAAYLPPRNESIESTIGVSKRLEPGTHRNVTVHLFADTADRTAGGEQATARGERTTTGERETNHTDHTVRNRQTLVAVGRYDTGRNGTFEFVTTGGREDPGYVTENGSLAIAQAIVGLDDQRPTTAGTLPVTPHSEALTTDTVERREPYTTSGSTTDSGRRAEGGSTTGSADAGGNGPFAMLPNPLYLGAVGLLFVMLGLLARIDT